MIKVIVFDFDGVIVDSVTIKTKAFAKLFEPEGEDVVKKVVEYHLNNTGVSRYEKFKYIYKEMLNKPLSEDKFEELCKRFEMLVIDNVIKAPYIKGAKEFLEDYSSEYGCFVASATPQGEIEEIVRRKGIRSYFKEVFGAPSKKSDVVGKVISRERVKPSEVLYIGDAMSDYSAAKGNSVNFIALANEGSSVFSGSDCLKVRDLTGLNELITSLWTK